MSQAEIERILGKPDYSPISGQYYHGTGGYCEMAPGRRVPCGYVLDYRGENFDHEAGISALDGLQDCWWGGIGE